MRTRLPSRRSLATLLLAAAALASTGCVGYHVYPPIEGERGFTNVNSDPFPPLLTESLRWVVLRYPPNASAEWTQPAAGNVGITNYAVNLPVGTNPLLYERIVKSIGPGAQPMLPGNESLPTYHIARVWVSGDDAKVDVIRPVVGVVMAGNQPALNQAITLRLRGGLANWHVTSHKEWAFNALVPPAPNYLDGTPASAGEPAQEPVAPSASDSARE